MEGGRPVDIYGFFLADPDEPPPDPSPEEVTLEASRQLKWTAMLASWESTRTKFPQVLKRRCRKGIPNGIRGQAWAALSGGLDLERAEGPGRYRAILAQPISRTDHYCISLDLHRTWGRWQKYPATKPEKLIRKNIIRKLVQPT